MDTIIFDRVSKLFRHRRPVFDWIGQRRRAETRALDQVSFSVGAGRILALLGPNGSGKTTTLKLIATTLLPDAGRVMVEGFDTQKLANQVRKRVGLAMTSERSFFPRLSARENLEFFAALEEVPRKLRGLRIAAILERTGLAKAADTEVMKFSSGMYQKLAIARALIKQPSIVLLDEPTRSLDPGAAAQTWDLVRELPGYGASVLMATHNFEEASAVADEVILLDRGRLSGQCKLSGARPVELRELYFQVIGQKDEFAISA